MVMKTMLSMPRTISRAARVSRLIHASGVEKSSIIGVLLRSVRPSEGEFMRETRLAGITPGPSSVILSESRALSGDRLSASLREDRLFEDLGAYRIRRGTGSPGVACRILIR